MSVKDYNPQKLNFKDGFAVNLKRIVGRLMCLLFWHKIIANDSGYQVCGRCGAHEFYDSYGNLDTWESNSYRFTRAGYLLRPFWYIKRRYRDFKYFKEHDWGRDDGLPF
jgi:hypothetical protein